MNRTLITLIGAALLILLLWFLFGPPAHAAQQCHQYAEILSGLRVPQYGEVPAIVGATLKGDLMVLTENPEKGNWTLLSVRPDGCAAIITAGQGGLITVKGQGL